MNLVPEIHRIFIFVAGLPVIFETRGKSTDGGQHTTWNYLNMYYVKLSVLEALIEILREKKKICAQTPLCYTKQYFVMQESVAFQLTERIGQVN